MISKRTLKVWSNLILLIIAFPFIGIVIMVIYVPEEVDAFGSSIVKAYQSMNRDSMTEALEDLDAGIESTVVDLLHEWEDIQKIDRLYPLKRTMMFALSEYLYSEDRYQELLHWSKIWYDLDERDITASAYYYEALRHSNDNSLAGEEGLRSQFYRFPNNFALQQFYYPLTEKYSDKEQFLNLMEIAWQTSMKNWQVFWDVGEGFYQEYSQQVNLRSLGNNRWEAEVLVSDTVRKFRLDPPAGSNLRISNITMQMSGITCQIEEASITLVNMKLEQGALLAHHHEDPYFSFSADSCMPTGNVVDQIVRFQFTLVPYYSFSVQP